MCFFLGGQVFKAGEARELAIAAGDSLLLQANAPGFTNGERVQVKALGKDGIALQDGRTLPPSFRSFTYGYAITSHAAQGKTVDEALFVVSSRSFAAVSRESFYVGISRARERVTVFTDDTQTLEKRVQDAHTRKAAIELEGLREELHKHGLLKAPQAAPDEARKREQREEARLGRELRPMRAQRLAPLQAVQRWAQEFRAWLGERFGHGQRVEPHLGRAQDQAVEPTQHQHKAQQKPISPDLAQRQKELLRRIQANALRQDRGQSRGHGYGHGH